MRLLAKVKDYATQHSSKKIAMFVDMDGTIASLEIDINNSIYKNDKGYFLNKRPLKTVLEQLNSITQIPNIDLFILSACTYKEQALEKSKWLEKNAPFFLYKNQIFVIKEIVKYTYETKGEIKVNNILEVIKKNAYDLAIYLDDEYLMLRKAHKLLKDKILLIHISEVIE